MSRKNRETLRNLFKKGSIPTEANFADLVDSTVNIVDDGFHKTIEEGLKLSPTGDSEKLITFYRNIEQKNVAWSLDLGPNKETPGFNIKDTTGASKIFVHPEGHVGIDTTQPKVALDVNGLIGSKGRMGTYAKGQVLADGKWRPILEKQDACNAYEIVARVGKKESGRYALLYAMAMSTFGRSHQQIWKVQARYGWFWNKIALRWTGDTFNYNLEIKTRSDYGEGVFIQYHISKVWGDEEFDKLFEQPEQVTNNEE